MNKFLLYCIIIITLGSCASGKGVGRIKKYEFAHQDVPAAFDGYKIAFISDLHYKSLFTEKRLDKLVKTLNKLNVDILLMGGDYHEGCQFVPELFEMLARVNAPDGIWAILGNHDYNACYDEILAEMKRSNIHLLEHALDTIHRKKQQIILAGVRNPFDLNKNGISPTNALSPQDFVILLVHTPDYAEQVPIDNTDLVLSGHTHGGQVTMFGLYAPISRSKYGFRTGLKHNSNGVPIIVTNGVGTSNKNIRMFAPSEIVQIILKQTDGHADLINK
jgi:Predicted phosphohydrolases